MVTKKSGSANTKGIDTLVFMQQNCRVERLKVRMDYSDSGVTPFGREENRYSTT